MECVIYTDSLTFDREFWLTIVAVVGTLLGSIIGAVLGWILNEQGKKKKIIVLGAIPVHILAQKAIDKSNDPEWVARTTKMFDERRIPLAERVFEEIISTNNIKDAETLSFHVNIDLYNSSIEKSFMREITLTVKGIMKEVDSFPLMFATETTTNNNIASNKNIDAKFINFEGHTQRELSLHLYRVNQAFCSMLKSNYILKFGTVYLRYKDKHGKRHRIKLGKYKTILKSLFSGI